MAKQLRNKIADINKHKLVEAQLIDTVGDLCAVKIGGKRGNGGVLRGIPFIGPPGAPGQKVYVDYTSGKPIVQIFGQAVEEAQTKRTIRARPSNSEPPSQGGSSTTLPVADHTHDAILLTGVSSALWYEPTESGLSGAIADAQDGDTIYLPDYHFNGPFTIPHGVNFVGSTDTQLQYLITLGGDNVIRNVNFWQSIAGQQYCVDIPYGAGSAWFYDCNFNSSDGTQDIYVVKLGHGGEVRAEFWNCYFYVYASNHDARAFYSTVAHGSPSQAWTKLFYCHFDVHYVGGSHTEELWNSNCKLGTYGCSWRDGLDPGANVFWIDGDRFASAATDPTAIHTDGTGEISGLTEKASPIDGDVIVIEDSEAGYVKKKSQIGSIVPSIDTGNFDRNLSAADDTIQKALDTLDDAWLGGGSFSDIVWTFEGAVTFQSNAGASMVVTRQCVIEKVAVYAKTTGTSSSTIIDINKNGTSIFVSNPTLAFDDADGLITVVPDTTAVSPNDIFTIDIDQAAVGVEDVTVVVAFSMDLGAGDVYAIHDNQAGEINALTEKTTLVDNDIIVIEDSEDGYTKKKSKIESLPFSLSSIKQEKIFTREGVLAATSGVIRIANHSGSSRTITGVYLNIDTAPTGQAIIVDIHKNGTTIFTTQSNRPQIAATQDNGSSTTIEVPTWADGQYLTCDVDQIGSVVEGSNLTVTIAYSQ